MSIAEYHKILKRPSTTDIKVTFENFVAKFKVEFENGWIMLWQHHGVFVGELKKGQEVKWLYGNSEKRVYDWTNRSNIVRLRAFDQEKEYHFWRSGSDLKGRLRSDKEGNSTRYLDSPMKLRSVIALPLNTEGGFSSDNIMVVTRNYIDFNPLGQAGYVDSRFVEFAKK